MSFARILRASVLMGGASAVSMVCGLIRGKLVAIILGVSGVGLWGIANQYVTLAAQIGGLGLSISGVKYVSEASGDEKLRREQEVKIFARHLGGWGGLLSLLFALPVCWLAFGSFENQLLLLIAAMAVPFTIIGGGWRGAVQANGRIAFLAKTQICGAILSVIIALPLIWFFRETGLVLSVVLSSAIILTLFILDKGQGNGTGANTLSLEGRQALLVMGLALLGTLAVSQVAALAARLIVTRFIGIEASGHYQAAFSIAGTIPGFIFAAMSTDFYPRVAAAKTHEDSVAAIEYQIQAGIILAIPLLAGLVLFGPELLALLYSAQFAPASGLMLWMIWAVACRLLSWPLGYWLLAKATSKELFWIEGTAALLIPLLTWVLLPAFGLAGAGMAMLIVAVFYGTYLVLFLRKKTGMFISLYSWAYVALAALILLAAQAIASCGLGVLLRLIYLIILGAIGCGVFWRITNQQKNA